eukprot:gnl/TRDRNA2_/TRDRNA2_171484_c0_seq2.p1 gnl/TRDRNA2_/TRDRNA2_171484_c0~~gnl/TRDRNA2_/TRDRNA2_171484_c0_seq2.p1  ORF type:complete len:172 (+),score=9.97 gnl/TRDRNA2_/TRDRNA2_171484_c0_seq2:352-867(+)
MPTQHGHFMHPDCQMRGWVLLLGGIFFHISSLAFCMILSVPHRFRFLLSYFAELTPAILLLHGFISAATVRCERARSGIWTYFETPVYTVFDASDYMERPRWAGLCIWLAANVVCMATAQLVVWTLQRPWLRLLAHVPQRLSRAAVVVYVGVLTYDTYQRGYLDSVVPGLT